MKPPPCQGKLQRWLRLLRALSVVFALAMAMSEVVDLWDAWQAWRNPPTATPAGQRP